MIFKGNCTALVTPFSKNGRHIDFNAVEKLLDMQLKSKSAILVLGTTGESATLLENEKTELVNFVVRIAKGKVPILIGAGSNNTAKAVESSKKFQDLGADALLHVTPFYNKASQEGLFAHFESVANSTSLPIVLYNVPSRTGVNLTAQTVQKLSKIKNIVGIKEASGNLLQMAEILQNTKDFQVFCGDDTLTLPALSIGANGVISVLGNLMPQKIQNLFNAFWSCNIKKAQEIFFELFPLSKMMFCDVNPMPVKSALEILEIANKKARLPLTKISKKNFLSLKKLLTE